MITPDGIKISTLDISKNVSNVKLNANKFEHYHCTQKYYRIDTTVSF
jgi:hypothetical protein